MTNARTSRVLVGTVVSDRMMKTVVVQIDRERLQPKYQKRYKVSRRLKAHDERGYFHVGDAVTIIECRPLSKDKRWRVIYESRKSPASPSEAGRAKIESQNNGAAPRRISE